MKSLIHLRLTPLADDDPFAVEGKGATILAALADMEDNARTGYGDHIDFADSWDIKDLIETLEDPGTKWVWTDFSSPEDNCQVERLADVEVPAEEQRSEFTALLVEAIEEAGFPVSGPTDWRAAENGEPAWVCRAREVLASKAERSAPPHTKAADVEALLPEGWEGPLERDADTFAVMEVPAALIAHMRTFLGAPCSRVIGALYGGEDLLLHLEEILCDREELIADGWPPRFLDRLEKLERDDLAYLRITA